MRPLLALLVLLAACSDDEDAQVDPTPTTAEATTTTRPARATTTCAVRGADAVSTVDLDGDGVEERWVPAGRGASVDIVRLERVEGCEAVAVTVDGSPAEFAVGGTVLLLQGVRCEGEVVVHLGATSDDGETYATLDLLYELRDGALVRIGDRSGELPASSPELADYSSFAC